jgi:hypothetical protein
MVCKGAGQEECERVWKWRLTLPNELPFWELESQWTLEPLKSNCKGQNTSHWRVLYIIEKLLKFRCLKWACMTHLDIYNTSYGKKKGQESKLAIWLPTTKSQESTQLPCVQVACNRPLESFGRELQLCFRHHPNRRSEHEVIALQSCRSSNLGSFKTPLWESKDKKTIWMWASQRGVEYTIWGKVVASPESGPWWVLWI